MNFLKNLFKTDPQKEIITKTEKNSSKTLDDLFVENFIAKGGRFLYCQTTDEIKENLLNIISQEQYKQAFSFSGKLQKLLQSVNINPCNKIDSADCYFTKCEHLIAEDGSILFSSKQLKDYKLSTLPPNFIVFAKTSQLVNNKGESLTGIKNRYQKDGLPNNISAIKSYNPNLKSDDFMTYGNNNTKQMYLLLLEDL